MAITRGNQTLASRMDVAAALALVAAVFLALALALVPAVTYAAEQASGAAMGEAEDQPAPEEPLADDDAAPQEDGDGDSASVDVAEPATDLDDAVASQQPREIDNGAVSMAGDDAGEVAAPQDSADDDGEDAEKKAADPSKHYALRLIVDMAGASPRSEDAVLAERDGVYLLGFANEDAIAQAEQHYGAVAAWVQRDSVMGAAGDEADAPGTSDDEVQIEQPEGSPDPVNDEDNAIVLMEAAAVSGAAGAAGTDKPLVALIDTGAPADPAVVGSVSVVGDDVSDYNGHATAMLQAMKQEDPDVKVLAIKALDDDGQGSASSVYAAIEYAIANGAKIINLSLSGYDNDGNAAIAEAVQHALDAGIAVIAAAGNGGYDAAYITPANIPGVFTVGACDEDGNVLESSNRGECVDGYVVAESTSLAAACVSGFLGQVKDFPEAVRNLNNLEVLRDVHEPDGAINLDADFDLNGGMSVQEPNYSYIRINYGRLSWSNGTVSYTSQSDYVAAYIKKNYNYHQIGKSHPAGIYRRINTSSTGEFDASGVMTSSERPLADVFFNSIKNGGNGLLVGIYTGRDGTGDLAFDANGYRQPALSDGRFSSLSNNGQNDAGRLYAYYYPCDFMLTLDSSGPNGESASPKGTERVYGRTSGNGGGLYLDGQCTQQLLKSGSYVITPPKLSNYIFDGYRRSSGAKVFAADGSLVDDALGVAFSTNETLYASWKPIYTVTLDNDGADAAGSTAVYEAYGQGVYRDGQCSASELMSTTSNAITIPSKAGYAFGGYYNGGGGVGMCFIGANGCLTSAFYPTRFDSNATLYAKWIPVPDSYTITLSDAPGSGGSGAVYEISGSGVYTDVTCLNAFDNSSNKVSVPSYNASDSMRFNGYWTAPSGTAGRARLIDEAGGRTGAFVDSYFDGDATIYADWIGYEIALDDDGGSGGDGSVWEHYGTGADAGMYLDEHCTAASLLTAAQGVTLPTRPGYTFGGYYEQQNGGGSQLIDENGFITANFTGTYCSPAQWASNVNNRIYAYWIPDAPPPAPLILPVTGGMGENRPLLWGSAVAVVGAAGFMFFRALRASRRSAATASRVRKLTPRRRTPVHARMK